MMLSRSHKLRLELKNQEALKIADATIKAYPQSVDALVARADILKELGCMKEATRDLDTAHKIAPTNLEVLRKHSRMLDMTGRLEEALAEYDIILKVKANDGNLWSYRGEAHKRLKRYGEAAVDFRNAARSEPESRNTFDWLYQVGNCYYMAGNMAEALKAFDYLVKVDPEQSSGYWGRAKVLDKLGRSKEAAAAGEKAKKLDLELAPHDFL